MATTPTRILEIEFDTGVWTNVTADLVSLSTRRGRNRESGAYETGQLLFELRNDTRKYDPDHTAGTYYGKLRPNRRVRLRATYAAVTHDVFLGYIDRISQVSGGPNDATAIFQVSDLFKLLNRAELPGSAYAAEIADDTPALWWRLGEPAGSTTVNDSSGNNRSGTVTGTVTLGQASLTVRDPDTAASFAEAANTWIGPGKVTLDSSTPWAIEFWFRLNANPTFIQALMSATGGGVDWGGSNYMAFQLNNVTKLLNLQVANTAGTIYQANPPSALVANQTYHVVITHAADRVLRVYIDGALAVTGDTTAGTFSMTEFRLGSPDSQVAPNAVIDELAIYTATLPTAGRIAAHNTVGRTPWNGDDPGTRLNRIIGVPGMPAISAVIDAGEPTLQSTDLGGSLLAYAQKVEETALGLLFVAKNGDLTFVGRNSSVTGTYLTSQATLVDDDSGAGIPYRSADADVDEAFLVTRATVSRDGSLAVTVSDAAALTEFGPFDEVHDGLLHAADTYSRAYAEWIVSTHKAPSSRVGTVTLELTKDPAAMYPAILALELGQRVTYKRKPQNTGSVISLPMRVEAISHETGPHYWRTKLQLSPFNLATSGYPVGVWDVTNWDQSVWGI